MFNKNYLSPNIELFLPKLLDFTKLKKSDKIKIIIENSQHKFSPDAYPSGKNIRTQPIFKSSIYINEKLFTKTNYGLPFIRFEKNSEPVITWKNNTLFTFNIHYHGLNTVGSIDGTSMEVVFGPSTKLGTDVTFQFPKITNNQSLLWYHNHNMFISMELIYSGAIGLLEIVDKKTKWLSDKFKYGDNHLMLFVSDIDLTEKGIQTNINLPVDQNRSSFTQINGTSTINWYTDTHKFNHKSIPFTNILYHNTTYNLVKIDILNAAINWRVYHIGVCDENFNIKSFYLIQCDGGLINPQKLKMTYLPVAGRISILIDLNIFKNKTAYIFFYDYDLTEIFDSTQNNSFNSNDPTLLGTIPNFELNSKSIYPTPIPDPNSLNQHNQQDNPTNLQYPQIKQINQIEKILTNGNIPIPKSKNIKLFLQIKYEQNFIDNTTNIFNTSNNDSDVNNNSICDIIKKIKKTIFGKENYCKYYDIISKPYFEYDNILNYVEILNKKYFYNIPKIDLTVPKRNFLLFPETNTNTIASGNIYGVTEYIDSSNRIMVDLWNSSELDLDYAMNQYNINPNNFKPDILPSSKFKIYKTNDKFSNTAMISNDTIIIEFFTQQISYGDKTIKPIKTIEVIFPESDYINIQKWINLVNITFTNTNITGLDNYDNLGDILQCDWSFFPYKYQYMYEKNIYIKSAIIKTQNKSPYCIRILGRWSILQFFGKSLTGAILNTNMEVCLSNKINKLNNSKNIITSPIKNENYKTTNEFHLDVIKNKSQQIKCDEFGIYGIYDADIQAFFPFYATSDGLTQLPIACMKRNGELIICKNSIFKGFYDGYLNENLNSFSVKLKSNELWLYSNGDNTDNHPIHFHLTSGFAIPNLMYNSPGLLSSDRKSNPLTYSRDIYQVGPQQTIGFYLTWPYYSSNEKTSSPNIKGVGGVIHCHFLPHNDANSMIIKYYVEP